MRTATHAYFFLLFACLALGACVQPGEQAEDTQDPHQPGEALGLFSMTGKLADDNCGAESLGAPQTWVFDLKLSREGNTLYWLNGREAIVGDIDTSGRFAFETHLDLQLAAQRGAAKGCTIVRSDSAHGALDTDAASINGKLSYSYEATKDSECAEFVTGTSGAPLALPCSMTYSLSGERQTQAP